MGKNTQSTNGEHRISPDDAPHYERDHAREGEVDAQRSALHMYPHLAHSGLVEFLPGVEDEVRLAKPEQAPVPGVVAGMVTKQIDMPIQATAQYVADAAMSTLGASNPQIPSQRIAEQSASPAPQSPQPQTPEIDHRIDYELAG